MLKRSEKVPNVDDFRHVLRLKIAQNTRRLSRFAPCQELQTLKSELSERVEVLARRQGELEAAKSREEELERGLDMERRAAEAQARRLVELEEAQVRRAQLDDELATTRETMARREREAVEAVHHAAGRARQAARQEAHERLGGMGFSWDSDGIHSDLFEF